MPASVGECNFDPGLGQAAPSALVGRVLLVHRGSGIIYMYMHTGPPYAPGTAVARKMGDLAGVKTDGQMGRQKGSAVTCRGRDQGPRTGAPRTGVLVGQVRGCEGARVRRARVQAQAQAQAQKQQASCSRPGPSAGLIVRENGLCARSYPMFGRARVWQLQ